MIIAPLPFNEIERLENLESYFILDTPAEEDFDSIVHLASSICDTPISLISLLDKDRTWFKAKTGTDMESASRDVSFCAHAILQDGIFTVENALLDERFKGNPYVTPDEGIRFYTGIPIVSREGHKFGTVCVADYEPRTLTEKQVAALQDLSIITTRLLEVKRKNILLRKKAEEFMLLKSQAIRSYMLTNETTKQNIAHLLHEHAAQNLASALMLLQTCAGLSEPFDHTIRCVKKLISQTLTEVKSQVYQITPQTLNSLASTEILHEYLEQLAPTYPFKIRFEIDHDSLPVDAGLLLAMIRVTEQWLSVLAYKKKLSAVSIRFSATDMVRLSIDDQETNAQLDERQNDISRHVLLDIVQSLGGEVRLEVNSEKNSLSISSSMVLKHSMAI